jgi:predicted outer membrane repeat protein
MKAIIHPGRPAMGLAVFLCGALAGTALAGVSGLPSAGADTTDPGIAEANATAIAIPGTHPRPGPAILDDRSTLRRSGVQRPSGTSESGGAFAEPETVDVSDSRITFKLQGHALKIPYYRTDPLGGSYSNITRAVVFVHGIGRDGHGYYDAVVHAAGDANVDDYTIIIAPQFLIEEDIIENALDDYVLFWSLEGWVQGDDSQSTTAHPRPAAISSFSVVDTILIRLARQNINLRKIVVAGHSAGGQFVNRYSIGNQVEQALRDDFGITVSYVVANPSSYMYLDHARWIQGTQYDYAVPDSVPCPLYNHYKYGFDGLTTAHYMGRVDDLTLIERFRTRRVTYLLGTADTLTEYLDQECPATMQGRRRYDRGIIYRHYLEHFYNETSRPCLQMFADVPGVGHSGWGMIHSAGGRFALFDDGTSYDFNVVSGYVVKANGTGDYADIRSAVGQLNDGGTIALTDGTYTGSGNRTIDYLGKKIAIFSSTGLAESCVIDCQDAGQGVLFQNDEEYRSQLDGVTVKNGSGVNGGGVYCLETSPTFEGCVFTDNAATNTGGGVFCTGETYPAFAHCRIVGNSASSGAGVWFDIIGGDCPSVRLCEFANNRAASKGGGLYAENCSTIFERCTFSGNGATLYGGGAYFLNSTPCLLGCAFILNSAGTDGSAYYAVTSTVTNVGTNFVQNNASSPVGGRPETAAAIYLAGGTQATFANSIVAFNVPGPGVWCEEPLGAMLTCCDIYGNQGGDWIGWIADQLDQNGNICLDPLFCDAGILDFHLQDGSPCAPHVPPGCDRMGAYPVGCTEAIDYADQIAGNCSLTVTDRGIVGFMDATQTQGSGFVYPAGGDNLLYVGSLWIGRGASTVDNRDYDLDPNREWVVSTEPDGHIWFRADSESDQDIQAFFDDAGTPQTLGLTVEQESWGFLSAPKEDFVILRYMVENRSGQTLAGLYAGLFLDVDIHSYTENTGAVEAGPGLVYMTDGDSYAGVRLLAGERGGDGDSTQVTHRHLTLIHNPTYVYPNQYILDADKFAFLSASDPAHIVSNAPSPDDYGILAATGPFDLAPGETQEFPFAIIGGSSLSDLRRNAEAAQVGYLYAAGIADGSLGLRTCILPGGPNPFQSATTLRFQLARPSDVRLGIFDVTGRLVRRVLAGGRNAGTHALVWDGTNEAGRRVGTGIYLYRMEAGSYRASRKLLLIR